MTHTRIFTIRIVSLAAILLFTGICFGIPADKIFGKAFAGARKSKTTVEPFVNPVITDSLGGSSVDTVIQNAERLAAAHPSAANYLGLSLAYYQGGRYRDCIRASRSAIGLKPDYAEAYNNIAVGYQGLDLWDSAIAASKKAVRLSPGYQLGQNNLKWEISQKKLLYHNLDSAEQSVATSPTPENYVTLSLAYYNVGQDRDCVAAANKALVLRPDYAIAWNNMCAGYIALSEWDLAIVAGYEAYRIDSSLEIAKNNMDFAISQNGLKENNPAQSR